MKAAMRFTLLATLLLLVGCRFLTPQTWQLEQIHQTYTAEWSKAELPAAAAQPSATVSGADYRNTLTAIRNYRAAHPDDPRVLAHLTVLEGMIYLQSGQPGMARLIAPDVKAAIPELESSAGVATRDYLFARCFPDLVNGWEAVVTPVGDPAVYENAANGIVSVLEEIRPEQRAAAEVDSGGAYVATSAAVFHLWAHAASPGTVSLKGQAAKGAAALGPWIADRERAAPEMDWSSRTRYVEWYAWLVEQAK
jgi:hypothetical protein